MTKEKDNGRENSLSFEALFTEFLSTSGRPYWGAHVDIELVEKYLSALKKSIGTEEFEKCIEAKRQRDGDGQYHVTAVRPGEIDQEHFEEVRKQCNKKINLICRGIGMVRREGENPSVAYYVIVSSPEIDSLRAAFGLPKHTLHITLGFYPEDVHGVNKDQETEFLPFESVR